MNPLLLALLAGAGYLGYKKHKAGGFTPGKRHRFISPKSGMRWDSEVVKRENGLVYVKVYFPVPSERLSDSPHILTYYQKEGSRNNTRYMTDFNKDSKYKKLVLTAFSDFNLKLSPNYNTKAWEAFKK